jgi:protein-tyrosine phosphatase
MMAADPAYLESTLRQIDEKYGSFDEYRRKALKVSDTDAQTLRTRLTMP